ncbi:MAG: zinc-ribbon domain-containing protein [Desulfobacterales bacterium]
MIVTCEGCETGFNVDERLLKPGGSKVRCSKCRHVFVAHPPAPAEDFEEPLVLSDEMPPAGRGPAPAGPAGIDPKLDDLFEEIAAASDAGPSATEPEMLDVDDLILDESPPAALMAEADALDLNFDLDLEPLKPAGEDATAPITSGPAAEEEIGFDLELEPTAAAADAANDLPELDELELDLAALDAPEADSPQPSGEEAAGGVAASEQELDLDFDGSLENQAEDSDQSPAAAAEHAPVAASGGASLELLNELNLDLDSLPDATTTTLAKDAERKGLLAETDEIDLSDLETMLDGASPAGGGAGGEEHLRGEDAGAESADASKDLDLSFLTEAGEQPFALTPDTMTAEPSGPAEPKELATTDELDFSDLSSLLENARPQEEKVREIEDVELVLDPVSPAADAATADQSDGMLDIEAFLTADAEDSTAVDGRAAGPDEAVDKTHGASSDLEIEFEPAVEAPGAAAAERATTAVGAAVPAAGADAFSTEEGAAAVMTGATDVMATEPEEATPAAFREPRLETGRRSGGLLKALGGIALVIVLTLAALVVPRSLGIQIPYLTDTEIPILSEIDLDIPFIGNVGKLFKAEAADPVGRLKIVTDAGSVTAEFVENPVAGRLLVVKGKVRNAYDHPRSAIRVSTTLIAKGGTPIRTATVYAGNTIPGHELATLDTGAIQARLQVATGTAESNMGVKPGASLPFMVVFDQLPANIDEYSVEVADSKK